MFPPVAFLLLSSAAAAAPAPWLAPDPALLATEERALVSRLQRAEAIGTAMLRAQNQLGERLGSGATLCAADEGKALVTRTRVLGHALREASQSARAAWARVRALSKERSLAPLLDPATHARLQSLAARVEQAEARYLQAFQWQRRFVETKGDACGIPLRPAPGFSAPSTDTRQGPVAIIALGGGLVCPGRHPARGVVVLAEPRACYGGDDCACTPEPVLPGAIIGPAESASSADAGSR